MIVTSNEKICFRCCLSGALMPVGANPTGHFRAALAKIQMDDGTAFVGDSLRRTFMAQQDGHGVCVSDPASSHWGSSSIHNPPAELKAIVTSQQLCQLTERVTEGACNILSD